MKRLIVSLLAGLIGLGSVASPVAADTKVVLAYTGASDFTAAYVAKDQGIFAKYGLDVDLQLMANGGAATAAVTSGAAQFGGLTPTVLLPAVQNGLDLVVTAGALVVPTKSKLGLLARADLDLSQPGAFAGKTVGVPSLNGSLHVLARRWLTEQGQDPAAVNFIEMTFAQMPDALRGQQVDLIATLDPFYSRVVEAKLAVPAADVTTVLPKDSLISLYAASRDWVDANRDTVKAFAQALDEAAGAIERDQEAARKAIANYVKLPPELLDATPMPTLKAFVVPEQIAPWIEMSLQQKLISTEVDPKTLVAN